MKNKRPSIVDLVLKNAKVFLDKQIFHGGIAIDKGKIIAVEKESHLPSGEISRDLKGQLIIPGLIDVHAHLRDLNYSIKEDFFTGTCAAANGGITTVIDMPNTSPPTISAQLLREKINIARKKIVVNTGFYAGIPNTLNELDKFNELGIFGFKLYLSHSLGEFDITEDTLIQKLLHQLKSTEYPLLVHAERKRDIETLAHQEDVKNLPPEERYLQIHSEMVEKEAISSIIKLNTAIRTKIHICHLSTALGVEAVQRARERYGNITAEVTPHHLFLTKKALETKSSYAKMVPPLRSERDVDSLWRSLLSGCIDMIATDHAPDTLKEKEGDFSNAANGIPGFETLLPLLLTALDQGKINLSRLIKVCSENPAKFLNLSKKGKIVPGNDADLTIVDLKKETEIKPANFYSKAKFSPFEGKKVKGIPTMTIINGNIIMYDGEIIVKRGSGDIIHRPL